MINNSAGSQGQHSFGLTNLLGTWVNVNDRPDYISCFELVPSHEAELVLKILSTSNQSEQPRLHLDVYPVASPGSELAAGFYHCRQAGLIIAANEKNGVLVLQCYRQQDAVLTREFYYRKEGAYGEVPPLTGKIVGEVTAAENWPGQHIRISEDFQALAGCWQNTYCQSRWMKAFSVEKTRSGWMLEIAGDCNGVAWPAMPLMPYYFDHREMGFVACCDLARTYGLFCAYSNKGLMVVSIFFIDKDMAPGQTANKSFCREFYAKQPGIR